MKKPIRVLITGAHGFIGRNIFSLLEKKGFQVIGTTTKDVRADSKKFYQVDITKITDLEKLPSFDVLVHMAATRESFVDVATNKKICEKINVDGTSNVVNIAFKKGVKHVIYISSNTVYGPMKNRAKLKESNKTDPDSIYGKSKLEGELRCEDICKKHKIALTILRLSSIFGVNQNQFLVYHLVNSLQNNKDIIIYGAGEGKLDLLYVKDVSELILLFIQSGKSGIYNVGSGKLLSVNEIVAISKKVFNESKSKILKDSSRKENRDNIIMDISKIKKETFWKPAYSFKRALIDIKNSQSS